MSYRAELAEIVRATHLDGSERMAAQIDHLDTTRHYFSVYVSEIRSDAPNPIATKKFRNKLADTIELWQQGHRPALNGMLDEARWVAVVKWAKRWGTDYRFADQLGQSPFRQPCAELDPNWENILRNLTVRKFCPHPEWLLTEADRVRDANKGRFELIDQIRLESNVPNDEVVRIGLDNQPVYGATKVSVGQYAYDRHREQVVRDSFDPQGWEPVPGLTVSQVEAAVQNEFEQTRKIELKFISTVTVVALLAFGIALALSVLWAMAVSFVVAWIGGVAWVAAVRTMRIPTQQFVDELNEMSVSRV